MRKDCLEEVSSMLGRQLSASQGKRIEERVREQFKVLARQDPEGWRAKSYTTQLHEAAAAAAEDMKEEFAKKRQNVEKTIAVHDRIENFLASQPNRKAGDTLRAVSKLLDFDTRGGGYTSVHSWATSIRETAFGELRKTWEAIPGNFYGLFEDKKGVGDLWKELHGEDSGNSTAKQGAAAWKKTAEELRQRFNDAGGHVGKLDEPWIPQHHSQLRVANAGPEQWISDILPKLKRDKYVNADGTRMSNDQMHQFLLHAFDSITSDGHNGNEPGTVTGTGIIANRNAAHRQIFFKDADAHAQYNALYGEKSMNHLLSGHVARMARDIALMERMGPNSAATFKYFNDRAMQDEIRQDPSKKAKLEGKQNFNEALFDVVSGKDKVVNQKVANAGQGFRNWMTATKLGKVVITALSDEAGMMSTAMANHVSYGQALIEELKRVPPGASRKFAEHTGLGIDAFMAHMNRYAQEEFGASFSGKIASSVMKASGAERMWAARRQGMGVTLMSSIGKLTRSIEHVDGLSVADHGVLAKKGVTDTQWQVWRRAEPENWGGTSTVLTPKSIWAIPDAALKDLGDPTALKREATTQLMAHIHEEAGMGAMDTGPRQRLTITRGTQRGTVPGEIWRSMMLFKGFAASMMLKHWARAADMPGFGKIKYMAPLVVYGTIMGAVGNQIRSLILGQNPENMNPKENLAFWGKALLRGGGLGFFGEFLQSEMTEHDTSLAAAFGGPIATTLEDLLSLTHGAYFKSKHGQLSTDEKAKIIRFVKGNIPLMNMWYTQAATDHLLWNHIQEAANPGYLARMQAKQEANYGKTYYWRPDEALPHQGPDMAKALGANTNANFAGNNP
jgi:hypothetical protein